MILDGEIEVEPLLHLLVGLIGLNLIGLLFFTVPAIF
jgi:hypothetical protein